MGKNISFMIQSGAQSRPYKIKREGIGEWEKG